MWPASFASGISSTSRHRFLLTYSDWIGGVLTD
jgi:hypothetical protein